MEVFYYFGFNSPRTPPQNNLLRAFEDDLYSMIHELTFSRNRNDFQQKLHSDAKSICSSSKMLVPADKSTNLYEMDKAEYEKLLQNSVTKAYKKCRTNIKTTIDFEAKEIAANLDLSDRIAQLSEKDAFITLKDHKENWS